MKLPINGNTKQVGRSRIKVGELSSFDKRCRYSNWLVFWVARFKGQALLGMSDSSEISDYTCATQRIDALDKNQPEKKTIELFVGSEADETDLPISLIEYLTPA